MEGQIPSINLRFNFAVIPSLSERRQQPHPYYMYYISQVACWLSWFDFHVTSTWPKILSNLYEYRGLFFTGYHSLTPVVSWSTQKDSLDFTACETWDQQAWPEKKFIIMDSVYWRTIPQIYLKSDPITSYLSSEDGADFEGLSFWAGNISAASVSLSTMVSAGALRLSYCGDLL